MWRRLLLSVTAVAITASLLPGVAQATPTPMTALINGDSVTTADGITDASGNPISLEQFAAQHLGYTVTVVSGSTWDSMSQSDFAKYSLLVNGDPICSGPVTSTISNASTWAPVVMGTAGGNSQPGNRALVGTDPEFHYAYGGGGAQPTNPSDPSTAGAEHLVEAGMHFAGDGPAGTTGVYYDSGCGDEVSPGASIPVLDQLTTTGPGNWTEDSFPPCGGNVQQIASVSEFSIVSDSDIQGWGCSDHSTWPKFPADWNAEAVATDTASQPTCGTDPSTGTTACGEAYVLLAGKGVTATAPDISLDPTSATNPAGTSHTVTATVSQGGTPTAGAAVTFAIASGPNAGASGTCTFSDNSPDAGCTTGSDGKVLFTYSDAGGAGTDSIDASVTLSGSTEHATATKTWVAVTDPKITASSATVTATEGRSFNGTVATFTDPDPAASSGEYSATITWGDGSPTDTGTITQNPDGSFSVTGAHTYNDEGPQTVTVTITDTDNTSNNATVTDSATVNDAALHASGAAPATSPQSFNGPVATFTDDNSSTSSTADFTSGGGSVTIDWGDGGPTSNGTVSGSGGSYSVNGSHTYSGTGYFTIKVHIVDDGGSTADASSKVLIFGTASGGNFVIGDKNSAIGTAVTFWGAQWWKLNTLSGGVGPASFKGFEDQPALPKCGQSWTTDPGNSTPPPTGPLPTYMAVIVSSKISQSGSTISGDSPHLVVVKTDPGYDPSVGHAGTGTVVATSC